MKLKSKICYSGIALYPISLLALWYLKCEIELAVSIRMMCILAMLPTLYVYSINSMTYANGKREYGLLDAFSWRTDPYAAHSGKNKAMRPTVIETLLSKKPKGIIIGKSKGEYVVNDLLADGAHHTVVIGTTGCGKTSSVILPTVIANPDVAKFVVDIKGEISEKGEKLTDEHIALVNPSDRNSYGYDPLYRLSERSTEQEIIDVVSNIVFSIIPINASEKNPFWLNGARDMLSGLSIFYIKRGIRNLIDIIDEILGKSIAETVDDVINEADSTTAEYRYIIKFSGMADETLSGIYAQLSNSLTPIANDYNLRHMLGENLSKVSPRALNEGKSVYLVIKEDKLSQYAQVLHLIINQVIAEMELRSEDCMPVLLIIDELARITATGKIHKIADGLATLRSRNVSMLLVTQSIEALENAYSKAEVSAMITNLPYKIVLQASSSATQKDVIGWCGKYKEYKETVGRSGQRSNRSMTYEEKDIVNGADLMALPTTGDAILISPYGYNRVRKAAYYKDKKLAKKAREIKEHNKKLKEIQNYEKI